MTELPQPTGRELEILRVLWEEGEASVRQVYESLREELPIVQNTVQAFLRTMEEKGLVAHRTEGRTFVYRPVQPREETGRHALSRLLDRIFDGSVDQLVESALSLKKPSKDEIDRLKALVQGAEDRAGRGRS